VRWDPFSQHVTDEILIAQIWHTTISSAVHEVRDHHSTLGVQNIASVGHVGMESVEQIKKRKKKTRVRVPSQLSLYTHTPPIHIDSVLAESTTLQA